MRREQNQFYLFISNMHLVQLKPYGKNVRKRDDSKHEKVTCQYSINQVFWKKLEEQEKR